MQAPETLSKEPKQPWRPAPLMRLVLALHVAGAALLIVAPAWWPWSIAMIAGSHVVLGIAVLFPRAPWLGPNLVRLPEAARARSEVALTLDDGPDPDVTPRVLDLLDRYQARASFFCVGRKAAAHPGLVGEIARRGHSIENHSHSHSHAFAFYGWSALGCEVDQAQQAISTASGITPRFFRAPAGFRSPFLDYVLAARGLRYVSWTRRGYDTVSCDPDAVLARLVANLAAGDVLLLHDGCRTRLSDGEFLAVTVLQRLLDRLRAEGLRPVTLPAAFDDAART